MTSRTEIKLSFRIKMAVFSFSFISSQQDDHNKTPPFLINHHPFQCVRKGPLAPSSSRDHIH